MTNTEADFARYTRADLARVAEAAFVDGMETRGRYCACELQQVDATDEVEQFRKRFALKETP